MEFNITTEIEKTINAMIQGPRGLQFARLYSKYSNIINFTIIYAIGMFLYTVLLNLNMFVAIAVLLLWTYSMTVGPLGHIWGFKIHKEKDIFTPKTKKLESEWKKIHEKPTTVEYREVHSNVEKIDTPDGPLLAEPNKDIIVRDASGKQHLIKKEIFDQTYESEEPKK